MDGIEQILFQTNPFETTQEYLSETAIAIRISPTTSSSWFHPALRISGGAQFVKPCALALTITCDNSQHVQLINPGMTSWNWHWFLTHRYHHWSIHQLGTSVVRRGFFPHDFPPCTIPMCPNLSWAFNWRVIESKDLDNKRCVYLSHSQKDTPVDEKHILMALRKTRFTEMRIKTYQNSRFTAPGGILPSHIRG